MSMPLAHDSEWVPEIGIGERLRVVRRGKRRTQDEMAALVGVKKDAYAAWESGRNTPSLQEVQKIARRLYLLDRVPTWWTLGAEDPTDLWRARRDSNPQPSDPRSNCRGRRRTNRRRGTTVLPLRPRHLRILVGGDDEQIPA